MNRMIVGLIFGAFAGILDVLPMVIQKLNWEADISAFCLWVVVGFLISTSHLELPAPLKGIVIAFLVLIPCAVIIGWNEPASLIPIGIMTLLLGGLLGFAIEKYSQTQGIE